MDGIELALRFSYIVNKLRYCGPPEASGQFLRYLDKKDNAKDIEASLDRFEGLHPYLSAIAKKAGKRMTDYEVVEAYWLGNDLLDQFNDEDMKDIIRSLLQRGLLKSIGDKLIASLPSGLVPHHNFNVFYVGVGALTGSVETNLQNMDNCRVSWGKVAQVMPGGLLAVQTNPLEKQEGRIVLGDEETRTAMFLQKMIPDVKKGDYVALHWGFASMILTETQLENLKKYTRTVLDAVNCH